MKRTVGIMILGLGLAGQGFALEPIRVPLSSTALPNWAVVLSASSFDENHKETPIIYYTAYGSEVMLPRAAYTFSEQESSRTFKIGGESCKIDYHDVNFTVTVGRKAQELIAAGLGYQPVPVPVGANSSYLVAFPRGYSYEGRGRLFCRSGSVQSGTVDGVNIALYDDDLDGRYVKGKDGLSVANPEGPAIFGTLSDLLPTPKAVYEMKALAEDGSSLTLSRYAGPTGRLKVGQIPNVECRMAFASEDGKCSFGTLAGEQGLVLPAGKYRFLYGFLYRPSARHVVGLVLRSEDLPVVVGKDEEVTVTLGDLAQGELPWGEGVVTMTFQHMLALDLTAVEDAYNAGDYAKGQKLLEEISGKCKAGLNYEATKPLMEGLRQSQAMENSAEGTALREAETKVLTALKAGKLQDAKALLPDAQKALRGIPAQFTNTWSYLVHKTRVAGLAKCTDGTWKPGLKLTLKRLPLNGGRENAASETADTVDYLDPVGDDAEGRSRLYQGFLVVPRAGEYELSLESVGTAKIFLDGNKILDHPRHVPAEKSVKVALTEGPHELKIDVQCSLTGYTRASWTKSNRPQMVRFRWVPPGEGKAIVPAWAFEHRADQ